MRKRAEPAATTTGTSGAPAQPAATRPAVDAAERLAIEQVRPARAAMTSAELTSDATPAKAADPGDFVTVTIGKESFCPVKYNGFDVGPIAVSVTVREGETHAGAYRRARLAASVLFEAEFDLRVEEFRRHLEESRVRVRSDVEG